MTFIDQTRLEAAYEDLREQGQQEFSAWLPYAVHERCRTHVAVGDIANTILDVAQEDLADVIIMRAPQRRWWRSILAGSVTDAVRRRASVPVIVWDGHEKMVSRGMWSEAQPPHGRDPLQQGTWPNWRRAPWEKTHVLKS
jgi:hypothetical protein